ncbi:hypothetical protein DH2020_040510 [Rehmannia glutinosa]|uniref:WAT1-related protein n=1 Tax=Rehmannia glutinosa TaxID=99300 RepID=A0ABR0UTD1_REHGL
MEENKALMAVICIQMIYAGYFLLTKLAFDVGMNTYVFVFYRQATATLFLAPIAIFLEWITMSLDIVGVALKYTSASLGAATSNTLPVITFFLAVLLRMEKVNIRTSPGMMKIGGVSLCMGGVATIAFYRGPSAKKLPFKAAVDNSAMLFKHNTGIVVTGVTFYLQTWVVEKKGPVFLAMTTPMIMVFTIIISAFVLGEIISSGSILGALLLVGGLYFVLWGKTKEEERAKWASQQPYDAEKACGGSKGEIVT